MLRGTIIYCEIVKMSINKQNKTLTVILIILSAAMLIPIIIYSANATPAYDDFSNALLSRQYWDECSSSLAGSIARTRDHYLTVGGYYFAAFINFFLSPFLRWGVKGLRVANVIMELLFYGSAFFLTRVFVTRRIAKNNNLVWLVYVAFIFCIINNARHTEIYSWYCVLIAYLIPLAVLMTALGLTVMYNDRKENSAGLMAAIAILTFLVSGSSLNIVAMNCGFFFLIMVYRSFFTKDKRSTAVFLIAAVAGAMINVAAPGNYVRHDSVSTDYTFMSSAKITGIHVLEMIEDTLLRTPYLAIAVVLVILIYKYVDLSKSSMSKYHPILGLLIVVLGTMAVDYPVFFGYSGDFFPDRCAFVQDMTFYILSFLWLLHLTGWLQQKASPKKFSESAVAAILICCMLFFASVCQNKTEDFALTTRYMTASILTGRLGRTVDYQMGLLDEIENSKDDDVVLKREEERKDIYLQSIGIRPYPDHWINESISQYYGKNSVYIEFDN